MGLIIPSSREPLGNIGMSIVAESQNTDEGTFVFPDIGFDFYYKGVNVRSNIYSNGNSWVGLKSTSQLSQDLNINYRDARCHCAYYKTEQENGKTVFRIRWEGYSVYNETSSIDLAWELIFYDDNTMVLVIDKVPVHTGTNTFDSAGNGTLSYDYLEHKSYVLQAQGTEGTNFTLTEGSYIQKIFYYLIDDGANGIKHWDDATSSWIKIGDGPVTEEMFTTYGNVIFNTSRTGIILTNPTLLTYTQNLTEDNHSLKETLTPPYRSIVQNFDYAIPTGIKSAELTTILSGESSIKVAVSIDSGNTWKVFNGSSWFSIDITDLVAFDTNGITPEVLNAITQTQWTDLIGSITTIRFAYYFKQVLSTDSCAIDTIRINYI